MVRDEWGSVGKVCGVGSREERRQTATDARPCIVSSFNALPVDQNSQSLMGRIAELEAALETVKSEQLTGDAPREDGAHWESKGAGLSEAERGMAADALAMIAQHQPSADPAASSLFPINTYHSYKAKRLMPFGSNPSPPEVLLFRGKASNVRVREVLALLPDEAIIHRLLLALDHMQAVGLDMGINTRLIQVQLDAFTSAVTSSKGEEMPGLDLSFATLLFHVLATSLEFQSVDTVLLEMDLTDDGGAYSYMTEGQRRDAVHEGELLGKGERRQPLTRGFPVTDLWYSAGQTLLAIVEHENNPNLNTLMALSLKHHYLAAHGKSIGAQCTLASALSLSQAVGLDELHANSDSQRRPSQRGATSKAPLANLAVLFPLYRSKEVSKGETESNALWFPSQSALIEESGRRLYCHFLAQTCLEQSHPSTLSSMVFAAHSGPTDGLDIGDVGAVLTWTLFRVAAAVQETQMAGPGSKSLEDALSQIVLPVGADKEDDRFACQSAVAELYIQYQLMASYRSSESANAHDITAARNILRHRRWLADQSGQGLLFTKAFALQRFTLEAALTLALYLLKEGQHDGSEVVLAEVTGAVDCLIIGPREERGYGQRLVDLLIHHNVHGKAREEVEAEQPDTLALVAQHLGFHTNHPIIDYLAGAVAGRRPTADAAASFWKAVGKQSGVLLASP